MPAYTPGGRPQYSTPGRTVTYKAGKKVTPTTQPSFGLLSNQAPFVDRLAKYGLSVGPGGPGTGPQLQGATSVGHPTPASSLGLQAFAGANLLGQVASGIGQSVASSISSSGGSGGGGGGLSVPSVAAELTPISSVAWKAGAIDPQNARAPSWWKPFVPVNSADMERPDVSYIAMLNTMIPYMSPEDQKRASTLIYETVGGNYFPYRPETIGVEAPVSKEIAGLSPTQLPVIDQDYFLSRNRAMGAMEALSQLREQTVGGNREKIGGTGIGYRFLQGLLGQFEQMGQGVGRYGGQEGGLSRPQYLALQSALDPVLAQAQTPEVGAVGAIGQMLAQPFFSQGQLYPFQRSDNRVLFGQPNPVLFG